jgi:hypothetical protein
MADHLDEQQRMDGERDKMPPGPPDWFQVCNRTVCNQRGADWWNPSTRAWYCGRCARLINDHNPGLCYEVSLDATPRAAVAAYERGEGE